MINLQIFDPYLIPLNPGLRFFPNMAPYSNDAPYFPLPSYKKLETLMTGFRENVQKPKFLTLNPP